MINKQRPGYSIRMLNAPKYLEFTWNTVNMLEIYLGMIQVLSMRGKKRPGYSVRILRAPILAIFLNSVNILEIYMEQCLSVNVIF